MSKNKDKQTTELTIASGTPEALKLINAKIAALKHIEESVYKTSGDLEGFDNIKTETKLENLIRAYSVVKFKEQAYEAAATDLGLKTYPQFVIGSGTAADWKKDILLRIEIINHKETLDKLNSFKSRMEGFLSEQDKKALLMKEMEDYLAK